MRKTLERAVLLGFLPAATTVLAQTGEVRFPLGLGARLAVVEPNRRPDPVSPEEPPPVAPVPRRRFLSAVGDIVLLEIGPWAFDRYVLKEDFAFISADTVRKNFRTGFGYDRDHFNVNQSQHPYHGSLFFAAARSNGYGFWESGAFALTGSLLWECCMENTPPSFNDLVNTTLGGMTRGEISHRLATMVRDNTSAGPGRTWRELGAAILDPVGAVTRLLNGDLKRQSANPDDRFPSVFAVSADLGYRHVADRGVAPDQAILSLSAYYGDPFAGDIVHPFDAFWAGIDLNTPGSPFVSRIEERGVLRGWELTDRSDSVRHIVGFSQEYEYFNNASQVFGAQAFGAGVLSRYELAPRLYGITDFSALVVPLAGIQTTDFENPETGRNYDYGVGGGIRAAARVFGGGREIAAAGYAVLWSGTVNGVSDSNTLQYFRSTLRVPIRGPIGIGGGYSWYSRKTTYPGFVEGRRTQSEWRIFVDFAYAQRFGVTETTRPER